MSRPETDSEDLSAVLADALGVDIDEIEAGAEEFDMEPPWKADWEYVSDE